MKDMPERDFSRTKSAKDVPALARVARKNEGKERITIRLDADVWAGFATRWRVAATYQTLINEALRAHISDREGSLERTLRRVIRDELRRVG